ncbi:MAG: RNA-binding transcriptional accessory protein, partial [Mycobacterium sp.]
VVKVKVLEVDVERQRIGLSLRLNDDPQRARDGKRPEPGTAPRRDGGQPLGRDGGNRGGNGGGNGGGQNRGQNQDRGRNPQRGNGGGRRESAPSGSMADALRKAGFGK